MGVVITRTKALVAAADNCICASQTPMAAGNLTINGSDATAGVATLDTQRRVLLTFAADETGHTFVVYGTKQGGASIQETVAGAGIGTYATNQDFLTVTQVSISHSATGAIKVGTNGVGSTDWQSIDIMRQPVNVGFSIIVTGTVNYTMQTTNQNVNALAVGAYPNSYDLAQFTALTYSSSGGITTPAAFFRLTINSGTGSCELDYEQAGP